MKRTVERTIERTVERVVKGVHSEHRTTPHRSESEIPAHRWTIPAIEHELVVPGRIVPVHEIVIKRRPATAG